MSEAAPSYLIDSDVLITAKNRYYAFPICPGFWDSLLHASFQGTVHSIDTFSMLHQLQVRYQFTPNT